MQYAMTGGDRKTAEPGQTAACPSCQGAVRPKCGSQVIALGLRRRRGTATRGLSR